jgi:hypothetical protein
LRIVIRARRSVRHAGFAAICRSFASAGKSGFIGNVFHALGDIDGAISAAVRAVDAITTDRTTRRTALSGTEGEP